jgi:hypothetical protein
LLRQIAISVAFALGVTRLGHEPHTAAARAGLTITDIVDVPAAAYRRLLEYEREAAELGYPVLA